MIVAVVVLIGAIATGYLDISQTREARAPNIRAADGAIRAQAGQTPAFEVQTGSVEVGTGEANVAVPKVEVKRGQTTVQVPRVEVQPPKEADSNAN
jgi:hypothetical protein